jgi:uncharacterized protein
VRRLAGLIGLLIALAVASLVPPLAMAQATATAPTFPALTGRVVDDAHVLSPQTQAQLTHTLADLEQRTSRQLVVVTLPSLQGYEIADYGNQLLRHWAIGQKGLDNGAVFIVVPSEHKVRIEVGYGLEPILTDALSSIILQEQVLPRFRTGDIEGGVVAGTTALVGQLGADTSAAEAKAAAAEHQHVRHHGGGLAGIIPLILLFFIISGLFGGGRRRGGGGMGWLLPLMFLGGGGGRGGGWGGGDNDGGGWGGGGGDGGGFSGGGGSGGGGGASGGW